MLQYRLFVILAPVTAALLTALLAYTWRQRDQPDARVLVWQICATLGWLIANTLELVTTDVTATLRWAQITYVFITGTCVAWLIFALHYTNHEDWLRPTLRFLLISSPALNFLVVLTNAEHRWFWRVYEFVPIGEFLAIQVPEYGPWFWAHTAYAYALTFVGAILIISHYFRSFSIYRRQSTWVVIGVVGPLVVNALYIFRLVPGLRKDYSPIGFAWAGIAFAIGIFRYRLFQLKPIARNVLIDSMNDGVLVLDANDRVVDANPSMGEILGQPTESLIGLPVTVALATLPDALSLLLSTEAPKHEQTVINQETKRAYDVHIALLPKRLGRNPGRLTVFHEVTEREHLIAELNTFAHTVAHDLRQPLGVIGGYAELLQEDLRRRDDPQLAGFAAEISRMAFKMGYILENLMSLASVRRKAIKPRPLNTAEIVEEVEIRLSGEIAQHQVDIVKPRDWPTALGYAPWIEQVWINYLTNALKYSGDATLVKLGGERMAPGEVRFWVRDYGPGLSEKEQAALFRPFTRLNYQVEGHGLGLSIVKRIVEKLGGEVGVESAPGEGSTFYFTLPAASKDKQPHSK